MPTTRIRSTGLAAVLLTLALIPWGDPAMALEEPTYEALHCDAPFKPWFLRRNEILMPVTEPESRAAEQPCGNRPTAPSGDSAPARQ